MEAAKPAPIPTSPDEHVAWRGLDHVQIAIPIGGEPQARDFFVDALGMTEVPKPPLLAARGGAWFRAGPVEIHVGVEADFVPARKAHPALLVDGLRALVDGAGLDVRWNDEIPGLDRCHLDDPFGNRIELIDAGRGSDTRSDQLGRSGS
jgi:catechol 2,3-dioxygenase-like lactoylglutathione lyase family enzyme